LIRKAFRIFSGMVVWPLLVTVECSIVMPLPFERVLTHLLSLTFYGLPIPHTHAFSDLSVHHFH
jgi:hypothetical protein